MRIALFALVLALTAACGNDGAGTENQAPAAGTTSSSTKTDREKKDRGDFTMLLDGVEWAATSASARLRDGKLKISGSRTDGSPSTTMVRQSITLDMADFDGPGTYTLGMMSAFSVVSIDTGAAEESDSAEQLADVLSEATMVRLQYAEVVIDSVSDAEITGHFSPGEMRSMEGKTIAIRDGRFRAIVKE